MLDSLAERYGMLPSQVLEQANTLDLWVFDVAVSWRNHVQEKALRKSDHHQPATLDTDTLIKNMEQFRDNQTKNK
jgi:hypothetical protein